MTLATTPSRIGVLVTSTTFEFATVPTAIRSTLSQPVGQGVYKTPGEAPTIISSKRSGQSRDQGLLQVVLQWLQHGQAQKRLEETFESEKEASEEPDANKWCHNCEQPRQEAAKCCQDVMQRRGNYHHDSSGKTEEEMVSSVWRAPHSHGFQRQPSPIGL